MLVFCSRLTNVWQGHSTKRNQSVFDVCCVYFDSGSYPNYCYSYLKGEVPSLSFFLFAHRYVVRKI